MNRIPYLLWRTGYHTAVRVGVVLIVEWCWNVFPGTRYSSLVLFGCHLVILVGLVRSDNDMGAGDVRKKEKREELQH
jgi:hypothetical protein